MEDVAKIAQNIIVMNKGRVEMTGDVAHVFSKGEKLRSMGLSVPEITQLTDKLKELGYRLPPHIYTVKYGANAILDLLGGNKDV